MAAAREVELAETLPSPSPDWDHALGLQVSIGVVIEKKERVDWSVSPFAVTSLMQRSPEHCLRIGDRILSINGQSVTHITTVKPLYDLLLGAACSCVRVVVDRVICPDDPVPFSVPRLSVQEHFGARSFLDHEPIFQGWIAKDGRFSSCFNRRWARLSLFVPYANAEISTKLWHQVGFCFCWGDTGPDHFVEKSRICFYLPQDSVSVTHLVQPLPGKQLPRLCTEFGFLLKIHGRSMKIFCDSEAERDVWMCVFNMASRSSLWNCDETGGSDDAPSFNMDSTLKPGSFATRYHILPPWIFEDGPIERAMEKKKAAKLKKERQELELDRQLQARQVFFGAEMTKQREENNKKKRDSKAEKKKQQEDLKQRQESEMAKARLREDNRRSEMQRHIDASFSSNLFHSVDIQGLMQAHCQEIDTFEVIATLMQATIGRLQALERQNAILHAENHDQNAVIDRLVSQISQQQPCSTSAPVTASLKESLTQLHDAALLSHQCFSAPAPLPPPATAVVTENWNIFES